MLPVSYTHLGRVDGAEVVMEQTQGDTWSVPVPLDQDGEYVVEIIAEDAARCV